MTDPQPPHAAEPLRPDPATFINPWTQGCLIRGLAWLRQTHAALPLPAPGADPRAGVPLDALYVPARLGPLPAHGVAGAPGAVDLIDLLARELHVAVLGPPGSGRTTMISALIGALTDPTRNHVTDRLGRLVPVLLPLRAMALDPGVRTLDDLLGRLAGLPLWAAGMDALLPALGALGQLLFVVDDLDALDDPELQDAVKEAILDGVWRFPTCSWLLTAEPGNLDRLPVLESLQPTEELPASLAALPPLPTPSLSIWYMQPFGEPQVRAFTQRWAALGLPDPEAGPAAEALLGMIAASPAARRMAGSPAMLALLCVVGTARGGLPAGGAALLDWVVAGWLAVLNTVPDAERVPMEARRAWVEAMARSAEVERLSAWEAWIKAGAPPSLEARVRTPPVSFEQAAYLLRAAQVGLGLPDPGADLAARFVFLASHRPGVLVARGGGLGFVHAEHQRFLAAVHLAGDLELGGGSGADGDRAVEAALDTLKQWSRSATSEADLRELFAVLSAREGLTERVLHQLLGRRRPRTLRELNDLGPLAAALAEGAGGAKLQPRAVEAAARLADEAVTRWARERGRVPRWARDLRALGPVDDLPALDLSDNPHISDLGPLAGKRLLSRLDLRGCRRVRSVEPLGALPALRWADLRGCGGVSEIEPLRRAHDLRWLDLSGTAVAELDALAGLCHLHALALHGCVALRELGPLSAARSLRALVISGCVNVFDLSPLLLLPSGGTVWVAGSGVRTVPAGLRWTVVGLGEA